MGKRRKIDKTAKQPIERRISDIWAWVALSLIVIATICIRWRFLSIPLERDEGEYAYSGQLILQGIPPYKLAYNMKLPGIYYAYALVMRLFGQSVAGIHVGLLLANVGAIVLLYFIGKRLFGRTVGLAAAAAYAVLSMTPQVFGTQAHATHFVVLPALGGILLGLKAVESRKLSHIIWSGVLLGLALTMKQQGVFYFLLVLPYLVWHGVKDKVLSPAKFAGRIGAFLGGFVLPFALICAVLAASGVFGKFWFWAISYAKEYISEVPFSLAQEMFMRSTGPIVEGTPILWVMAAVGLILVWVDPRSHARGPFVTGFFVLAFLTICPGFYFRQHYYITWLPAVALMVGVAFGAVKNLIGTVIPKPVPTVIAAVALLFCLVPSVMANGEWLFEKPVDEASHMMYGACPWIESQEIAKYIQKHTSPTDTIAVLGSEPEIYFYADRKSATGYIYTYALMEPQKYAHKMQTEMISEIEKNKPKYIVFVTIGTSWLWNQRSDMTIVDWATKPTPGHLPYLAQYYKLVGRIHTSYLGGTTFDTEYQWDKDAQGVQVDPESLFVFERK